MEDRERQIVTIVGDAGVGKSRLLYEFDNWIELLPETVRYFKGRARQEMQHVPYALLRDLFAFRFQIQDSDDAETVRHKVVQGITEVLEVAESGEMKAHLLGHLMGYDFSASEHLLDVLDDPQVLHEQALAHLRGFFTASCRLNPTVLFLEDLHWADDSSLDVINYLGEALSGEPLLIIAAARPALYERRPHWGEGQPFHRRLDLEPLTRRESRQLLDEILQKVEQVPDGLQDLVVSGAEGNPFFIEELIKMLIEDGVIVKGQEAWRVEPQRLAEVRVPDSLTAVLQARLDRLPLEERTILQQASVVGRLFWDRAVAHIAESAPEGLGELEVANGLNALRDREMVFRREASAFAEAAEYVFKHGLLRELTYASVLKRLRRVYHGLVADWLIKESGERASEHTGVIADHLEAAGRIEEATEQLLQAGDQARGLYAHQEAITAYTRALALLKEGGEQDRAARTLMRLGLTYHTGYEFKQAQDVFAQGFALWQRAAEEQTPSSRAPAPHALRLAAQPPTTLDPGKRSGTWSILFGLQLFRGLVEEGREWSVVPDIARSWEVLDGGCKYVFHLRDDILWSDGTPVTAVDFVFAWRRMLDPQTQSPDAYLLCDIRGARAFHEGLVGDAEAVAIRAIDDLTLVVELEAPTPYFLNVLHLSPGSPVPRHVVGRHGESWTAVENIVTNGPFLIESWDPGRTVLLSRDPNYRGRAAGNVERVEVHLMGGGEWSARLELYEADQLDVLRLYGFPAAERNSARQRHAGEYVRLPGMGLFLVVFDATRPPFDDVRVRQAFVTATDRDHLANVVLGGLELPATGGFILPGMPGHSPGIGLPYEPQRARQLLAQAGYPGGRGFPALMIMVHDARRAWADSVARQVSENLDVDIAVDSVPWPEHALRIRRRQVSHMILYGWEADFPDPDGFLRVFPFRERTGWQNDAFDRLLDRARRIMDHAERMKLYRQADRILMDEAPLMPLTYSADDFLVKTWVRGYPPLMRDPSCWKDVVIELH
jgi:ABC-type oligopeptide transport system substrate-binding subunit